MENRNHVHASKPRRLVAQSPPSILIVEKDPDLRAFLRASLQRWYQVAEVSDGAEAVQHLEHCPPRALIVGRVTPEGEEALVSTLGEGNAPSVLRLWSRCPPAGWADRALRHPFMRIDLLQVVDRLVHAAEEQAGSDGVDADLNGVEIEADTET